jgi:hypothetical protein
MSFIIPFAVDMAKLAKELSKVSKAASDASRKIGQDSSKAFGTATREASKSAGSIGKDFSKLGSELSKTFGTVSREGTKSFGSIAREASKTASAIARDMSMASKSMRGGGGSGGRSGGVLSWIGPGVGIGIGQKLLDGVMSGVAMPGRILGQWLTDSMELTQVNRKFDIVFGSLREQAKQWSADFAKEVNGSLTNTKALMARFQDTFVPLGFSRDKSFEMSRTTTRLATDLAASEGMSVQEAAERLQSAMIGNHEAVRIFGVGLSEVTLKQELFRLGITKNVEQATDQEKSLARLNFILRSTRDSHGSAARAQVDLRSQLNSMSAVYTEVSARMGMVFAPAIAKVVQFIKELGVVINNNLGPSEQWGKMLASGVESFLARARGIKAVVAEISGSVAQMLSRLGSGFMDLGKLWGDSDKFYAKIREMFSGMMTIARPHLIQLQTEFEKTFFRIAGGIMGVFGQSSEMIKVMMTAFLDSVYDSIVAISEQIHELTKFIPGSKAASLESEITNAKAERNAIKSPSKFFEFDSAGRPTNTLTDSEAQEVDRYFAAKEASDKKIADLIAKRSITPTALKEASARMSGLPAFDPASVVQRFSEGAAAGGQGFSDSKRGKDLVATLGEAAAKRDEILNRKTSLFVDYGLVGEKIGQGIGSANNMIGSFFKGAKGDDLAAIAAEKPKKGSTEEKIAEQQKLIANIKKQGKVTFTDSDSLWQKMQEQFSDKDAAVKIAQQQLKALQDQLDAENAFRDKLASLPADFASALRGIIGFR